MAGGLKKSVDNIDDIATPKQEAKVQDKYAMPEIKEKKAAKQVVSSPGHTRRDFRN